MRTSVPPVVPAGLRRSRALEPASLYRRIVDVIEPRVIGQVPACAVGRCLKVVCCSRCPRSVLAQGAIQRIPTRVALVASGTAVPRGVKARPARPASSLAAMRAWHRWMAPWGSSAGHAARARPAEQRRQRNSGASRTRDAAPRAPRRRQRNSGASRTRDAAPRAPRRRQTPIERRYSRFRRALSRGVPIPGSTSCSTMIQPS
jgi:hypothetical protein